MAMPFSTSRPLTHDVYGPSELTTQTASRSIQPLLHRWPQCPYTLQWGAPFCPSKLGMLNEVRKFELLIKHSNSFSDRHRHNVGGHASPGKIKLVDVFVGLLLVVEWGSAPGGRGGLNDAATVSFHGHRYSSMVIFCWIHLIPDKDWCVG